ncbi:hypothetical protein F3Y22_tig00110204pilonHSYRG00159 [Hibiscus syriacus]|uniref:Uncharacterized protein n=1 Tax=Hibiscus syriacus TaxID=106335 RepID=A0A6A3BEB0_HIBSY|nr:hypothetical protein F3Y22_tig00110204pilonHSYRG00159 [Hibiscus syriacus]
MHDSKSTGDRGFYILTDEVWIPRQGHGCELVTGLQLPRHGCWGTAPRDFTWVALGWSRTVLEFWEHLRTLAQDAWDVVSRWILMTDPTTFILRRWKLG